jgi:acetyltransferase-like isoleucine patch superfamily enzyme
VKAVSEVGVGRAIRFVWVTALLVCLRLLPIPPLRSLFLRLCGASIGRDSILQPFRLMNVDRGGFRALRVGANCFIGDEVLIDLAAAVTLEEHVTLAARSTVLTHINVGYRDHPLQPRYPARTAEVRVRRGSFVGAGAILLPGVTIGPEAFVAAGAVVNRDVQPGEVVGGVPIRTLSVPS